LLVFDLELGDSEIDVVVCHHLEIDAYPCYDLEIKQHLLWASISESSNFQIFKYVLKHTIC